MPEKAKWTRKFRITHDCAWAWHIGLFFCVEPKSTVTGKHDIYLFFCLGMHDFSIGMITEYNEPEFYFGKVDGSGH